MPHLAAAPTTRSLLTEVRQFLGDGQVRPTPLIAESLGLRSCMSLGLVGVDPTAALRRLDQMLSRDRMLWQLPDGGWLHLGAVTHGRSFTTPHPQRRPWGHSLEYSGLDVDIDTEPSLVSMRGWDRIPVRAVGVSAMAEVGRARSGRKVLVLPRGVMPQGTPLLALVPGPEGLRLHGVEADQIGSDRYVRMLRGLRVMTNVQDRPWSALDIELRLLATDPTLRRCATVPTSSVWTEQPSDRPAAGSPPTLVADV